MDGRLSHRLAKLLEGVHWSVGRFGHGVGAAFLLFNNVRSAGSAARVVGHVGTAEAGCCQYQGFLRILKLWSHPPHPPPPPLSAGAHAQHTLTHTRAHTRTYTLTLHALFFLDRNIPPGKYSVHALHWKKKILPDIFLSKLDLCALFIFLSFTSHVQGIRTEPQN